MISIANRIAGLEIFAAGLNIGVRRLVVPFPKDRSSDVQWALEEIKRLRDALDQIERETTDPAIQTIAREALKGEGSEA